MITYTITVYNGGDGRRRTRSWTPCLLGSVDLRSISDGGVYDAGDITWTLDLAPMSSEVLTYSVTVTASPGSAPS